MNGRNEHASTKAGCSRMLVHTEPSFSAEKIHVSLAQPSHESEHVYKICLNGRNFKLFFHAHLQVVCTSPTDHCTIAFVCVEGSKRLYGLLCCISCLSCSPHAATSIIARAETKSDTKWYKMEKDYVYLRARQVNESCEGGGCQGVQGAWVRELRK